MQDATVGILRNDIATQVQLPNKKLTPDALVLSYGGKPLNDDTVELDEFGLKHGNMILALVRVSGGAFNISQGRRINKDIPLSNEECIISLDNESPTMKLPCGHTIAPNSLAEYITNEISNCKTELKCPMCFTGWKLSVIKKMGLSDIEIKNMEMGLSKNYVLSDPAKHKQCPQCNTFLEKKDEGIKIQCPMCTKFEFCWNCLRKWKAPGTGYRDCGNADCGKNTAFIEVLLTCKPTAMEYSDIIVPEIRACPKCGEGINHKSGCKHMACPTCSYQFCFVCLKKWPCEGRHNEYRQRCTPAPRQTTLPKV